MVLKTAMSFFESMLLKTAMVIGSIANRKISIAIETKAAMTDMRVNYSEKCGDKF